MKTASLVIFTKNEIEGLKAMYPGIPIRLFTQCFAVDYRSTDGTIQFFKKRKVPVIHQEVPGRGEALRLAVQQATGDYLVFFSPDGNEDPGDIPKLLGGLRSGADMVIASRFMERGVNEEDVRLFRPRAWANRFFTFLGNAAFGGTITDSINGYRAITRDAWNRLHTTARGFAIEYQMSVQALKLRMNIIEFPTKEGPRIGGKSTAHSIPTGLAVLGIFLKELFV